MPLDHERLQQISRRTLAHYQASADGFGEGTRDHDVRQNIDALLRHVHGSAPLSILDFGGRFDLNKGDVRGAHHPVVPPENALCMRFAGVARSHRCDAGGGFGLAAT